MSDTPVSVQRSIRIGRLAIEERLLLRLVTWAILLALAVAVVLLRLQRLDELPPGLMRDEDNNGLAALRVLQGEHAVFFPDVGNGREASVIYVLALSTLLFGRTLFAMHLPTALGSAGMVFAVFWMGRLLFGRDEKGEQATPWRGLLIGGVAAGLMAVSIGQTVVGRTGIQQDHPHALASHPMSWTALVGMERTQMAVGRAGGSMRGDIALHLYGGPLCAYTFSRIRTEFSVSSCCCRLGESPGRDSVGGGFFGGSGAGGGSASHPFRSAPRTLLHAQQAPVGIRT